MIKVSTAEFQRNIARYQDVALTEPVAVTRKGQDRLVLLSAEEYERLRRRDRVVISAGELTDQEIALISRAEVPAEHAHLDEELKDWRP